MADDKNEQKQEVKSQGINCQSIFTAVFLALLVNEIVILSAISVALRRSPSPQIEATGVQPAPALDDQKVAAMKIILDSEFGKDTPDGKKLAAQLAELSAPARSK